MSVKDARALAETAIRISEPDLSDAQFEEWAHKLIGSHLKKFLDPRVSPLQLSDENQRRLASMLDESQKHILDSNAGAIDHVILQGWRRAMSDYLEGKFVKAGQEIWRMACMGAREAFLRYESRLVQEQLTEGRIEGGKAAAAAKRTRTDAAVLKAWRKSKLAPRNRATRIAMDLKRPRRTIAAAIARLQSSGKIKK